MSSTDATVRIDSNEPHYWRHDDRFLCQTETTIDRVVQRYARAGVDILNRHDDVILSLPSNERQVVGIVRHLHERLHAFSTNRDCRRCWLQQAHCICHELEPLDEMVPPLVRHMYLLTHHKEICLAVDTAKLILASFADASRLVIGGIPGEYQDSMKEMILAMSDKSIPTLVLFPSDGALTFDALLPSLRPTVPVGTVAARATLNPERVLQFDVIVLDGTWEQARRLYNRYILPYNVTHVQLSARSLISLQDSDDTSAKQLRRHPVPIREISTAHALQLLLEDIATSTKGFDANYERFADSIRIANAAAVVQLGPTRPKPS